MILYNIPSVSAVEITDGLVDGLLEHYADRPLGIKDTSGDIERTRRYINRYPQLAVYNSNDDDLAGAAELDVAGAISAVANVFPDLVAWVFRTHETKGDVAGAQAEVAQARELLARFPSHCAIKHLLHLITGLPLTHVRPPLRDLTADETSALARAVESVAFG